MVGILRHAHSLAGVVRLLERDKETRIVYGFSQANPSQDLWAGF